MRFYITVAFVLCILLPSFGQNPDDRHWSPQFGPPGVPYIASSVLAHGGKALVTSICSPEPSCPIQFWDGERWLEIGSMSGGIGAGLGGVTDGTTWYICGSFTRIDDVEALNVAAWDGHAWQALGEGIPGAATALLFHHGTLYAGGQDSSGPLVKSWNGNAWVDHSAAFAGGNWMNALASDGAYLYASGLFSNPGSNIARWDGANWTPLGSGLSGEVLALAIWNGDLYAAGSFDTAGGLSVDGLARWNGVNWESLGVTFEGGSPSRLQVWNGELYISGSFTSVNNQPAPGLARYDGTFHPLPGHVAGAVRGLAADDTRLYFSGDFGYLAADSQLNGAILALRVGTWNGQAIDNLYAPEYSNGAGVTVFALAHDGEDHLFAGGTFRAIGDASAGGIAVWNGSFWTALASSLENRSAPSTAPRVRTIALLDGELFAGGTFTHIDGVAAENIAIWNGSSWRAAGAGLNNSVHRLLVYQGSIIATGNFTQSGSQLVTFVARWNGSSWTQLGCCLSGPVDTGGAQEASVGGDVLYVAGRLGASYGVYRLVGNSFEIIGTFSNPISGLAASNGILYAGGSFTAVNGQLIRYLAKWDGISWSRPGSELDDRVQELAIHNGVLHIAGNFTGSTTVPKLNHIARLQGTDWQPLGSGLDHSAPATPSILALLSNGSDLYLGGLFIKAGQAYSDQLARWNDEIDFYASTASPTLQIISLTGNQLHLRVQGPSAATLTLEQSDNFTQWTPIASSTGTLDHTITTSGQQRFFRARLEQ